MGADGGAWEANADPGDGQAISCSRAEVRRTVDRAKPYFEGTLTSPEEPTWAAGSAAVWRELWAIDAEPDPGHTIVEPAALSPDAERALPTGVRLRASGQPMFRLEPVGVVGPCAGSEASALLPKRVESSDAND